MTSICIQRLTEERKQWRKDHRNKFVNVAYGFYAKPEKVNNTIDLTTWTAGIPGKKGTDWEGGLYKVKLTFPKEYPQKPPHCAFTPPLFHPNLYPSGKVCLSIVNEDEDWKPAITVKQILLGIQELLGNPNPNSPAHQQAYLLFTRDKIAYSKKIKAQALENKPAD